MRRAFSPPCHLPVPEESFPGTGLAHRLYLAFELRDEASVRVSQGHGIRHQDAKGERNESRYRKSLKRFIFTLCLIKNQRLARMSQAPGLIPSNTQHAPRTHDLTYVFRLDAVVNTCNSSYSGRQK